MMNVTTGAGRQRRMARRSRTLIRNPEQTPEQRQAERRTKLLEQVEQGRLAEAAIKFADDVLADAEDYALAKLANADTDLLALRYEYTAALAFNQKIKMLVAAGKEAERKLQRMKQGGQNAKE